MIRPIGIPGSHPSLTAELMLRHKGPPYGRFGPVFPAGWLAAL